MTTIPRQPATKEYIHLLCPLFGFAYFNQRSQSSKHRSAKYISRSKNPSKIGDCAAPTARRSLHIPTRHEAEHGRKRKNISAVPGGFARRARPGGQRRKRIEEEEKKREVFYYFQQIESKGSGCYGSEKNQLPPRILPQN